MHWINIAQIMERPLCRLISKTDRVLRHRLSPDTVCQIVNDRPRLARSPQRTYRSNKKMALGIASATFAKTPYPRFLTRG